MNFSLVKAKSFFKKNHRAYYYKMSGKNENQ